MTDSVKVHAADVDGQDIEHWHVKVEEDAVVPGVVYLSIWEEDCAGIYLDPADARALAQMLNDYANKVEY